MKIVEGFYFLYLNHATDHFDVFSSLSSLNGSSSTVFMRV